jgi:hypothetical protein
MSASADGDVDAEADEVGAGEEESTASQLARSYDYLLSMPIWNLTYEKVQALDKILTEKKAAMDALLALSPADLWNRDLDEFLVELDAFEAERVAAAKGGRGKKVKKASARYGIVVAQRFSN